MATNPENLTLQETDTTADDVNSGLENLTLQEKVTTDDDDDDDVNSVSRDFVYRETVTTTDDDDDYFDYDDYDDDLNPLPKTPRPKTPPPAPPLTFIKDVTFGDEPFYGLNDIVMLPDGGFVISTARHRSVTRFSSDGVLMAKYRYTEFEPFGLSPLPDNCIAVTQPRGNKVFIFDCEKLVPKESFTFNKKYKSLASDDGEKLFCHHNTDYHCFDIISKNNPESTYKIVKSVPFPRSVITCDFYRPRAFPSGNILIIQPKKRPKMSCIDQNSTIVFRYPGEHGRPFTSMADAAISKDYIFVADKTANKIHRLTHDGTFIDIPLTEADGILIPIKLYVRDGILAVLLKNLKSPKIKLYRI